MESKCDVRQAIQGAHDLPTLPAVLQRLQSATRDPNSDATRVARIIEDDPAMMARILKVVNSAYYATREPVTSLRLAIARLGFNAVTNVALATSVFSLFPTGRQPIFNRQEFWRHCVCTGLGACVVYENCVKNLARRYSRDTLHLAGLLHDVGKIVLEQYAHDPFAQAVLRAREQKLPLSAAEGTVLSCDHPEAGTLVGMEWHLGQDLLQVIRWHHEPEGADVEFRELARIVHAANYICNLEHLGDGGDLAAPGFQQGSWTRLGLTVRDIPRVVEGVTAEAKHSEVLLSFV